MRVTLALLRASWLAASSYRLRMLLAVLSLGFTVLPIYYVAGALQPTMADVIAGEGRQYFSFVLVGMATLSLAMVGTQTLPSAIGSGITSGTLEALVGTPARMPSIVAGMLSYQLVWAVVRAVVLLGIGTLFGATLAWGNVLSGLLVLPLVVLPYVALGVVAGALVLAFRTAGPLPQLAIGVSGMLGGVYFPTHVVPAWLEDVSTYIPLTYGLRALRQVWLEGASLQAVRGDLLVLVATNVALLVVAAASFWMALTHARRAGTLGHY